MSLLFVGHPKETDLALFAGGELGPIARWRIERHLHGCDWCRDTVADFFHLQGDMAELAELPSLDWDGMAQQIRERLEDPAAAAEPAITAAVPPTEPRRGPASPMGWRMGFAMAAAVSVAVVVYQISMSPGPDTVEEVALLSELTPERSTSELDGLRSLVESRDELRGGLVGEVTEDFVVALKKDSAADRADGPRVGAMLGAESESRSDSDRRLGSDRRAETGAGARLEFKEELVAEKALSLPGDTSRQMAPTAPREVVAQVQPSSNEPTREAVLADAIAPAVANEQQFRYASSPRRAFSSSGMTITGGLSIVPVSFGGDVEVGVTADGWLRFRTVDSTTGNITITHVYAQ